MRQTTEQGFGPEGTRRVSRVPLGIEIISQESDKERYLLTSFGWTPELVRRLRDGRSL
jgi:hypothetical protein